MNGLGQQEIEAVLKQYPDIAVDSELEAGITGYRRLNGKLFAVVYDGSTPFKLSLRCDPQLAKVLREKYETVLPAENLDRTVWNTLLCTGQLSDGDILDLVRLSYDLSG